jgi:uncharacterized damage-inducible protein DinB
MRQWVLSGVGGALDSRLRQQECDQREVISRAELMDRLKQTLSEVEGVLARFDADAMLEQRRIQNHDATVLEAIYHVVAHFAMHTGQIILLTKMLERTDLKFYEHLKGSGVWNHDPSF